MKLEVAYPHDLYKSVKKLPVNNSLACSALFNEQIVGGVLLICPDKDLKFFNVDSNNPPMPGLKFRMLNVDHSIYVIEIHLYFEEDKTLKFHLNPGDPCVRMFFKLLVEKQLISFHFYNSKTDVIASCVTKLDDEDQGWVIRNNALINKLQSNPYFSILSEHNHAAIKTEKNSRFYTFNNSKNVEQSFIGKDRMIAKLTGGKV